MVTSKFKVRKLLKKLKKYNFNFVILRYFNVAGADEQMEKG